MGRGAGARTGAGRRGLVAGAGARGRGSPGGRSPPPGTSSSGPWQLKNVKYLRISTLRMLFFRGVENVTDGQTDGLT